MSIEDEFSPLLTSPTPTMTSASLFDPPAKEGNGLPRSIAVISIVLNLSAQTWGMLVQPDLQLISETNYAAFTPLSSLIGASFAVQQLISLYWLGRFLKRPNSQDHLGYWVTYSIGNLCLAGWAVFWHYEMFLISDTFLIMNLIAQCHYAYSNLIPKLEPSAPAYTSLPTPYHQEPPTIQPEFWDTHILSSFALSLALLDVLHNSSVVYQVFMSSGFYLTPGLITKFFTALTYIAINAWAGWMLGGLTIWSLVMIACGQVGAGMGVDGGRWAIFLGALAGVCSGVLVASNWSRARGGLWLAAGRSEPALY